MEYLLKLTTLLFLQHVLNFSAQSQKFIDTTTSQLDTSNLKTQNYILKLHSKIDKNINNDTTLKRTKRQLDNIGELLPYYIKAVKKKIKKQAQNKQPDVTITKYVSEIKNYEGILDEATKKSDYDSITKIIDFIESDLNVKYLHSKTEIKMKDIYSLSEKNIDLVDVLIRVFDDSTDKELKGYNVFVKPQWSLDERLIETFNPTNHARKKIAPGIKVIWIEKNGSKISQRQESIAKFKGTTNIIDFRVKL